VATSGKSPATSEPPSDRQGTALQCVEVLGQLAGLFDERRKQLAEAAGLTVQQWQMLEEVQHEHFMPTMFAEQRSSSAAAVSKILRQLTDKGLITAHVSERDARQRDYVVTSGGKELLTIVRALRQEAIDEVWLKLNSESLEQFLSVGGELVSRLNTLAAAGRPKQQE